MMPCYLKGGGGGWGEEKEVGTRREGDGDWDKCVLEVEDTHREKRVGTGREEGTWRHGGWK